MTNNLLKYWIDEGQTVLPTLLLKHYRDLGISNNELVLILQIKSYIDKGELFPDMEDIARNMQLSKDNVFRAIHQLIQKKLISIDTTKDENGMTQDAYSLSFLWDKLFIKLKQEQLETADEKKEQDTKSLYTIFEEEFGRPLSPIEMETLVMWVEQDKYSLELVKMALKEAVLSQVYNFKYIDRILLNWEKKNIRTKEQVEKESQKFRGQTDKQANQVDSNGQEGKSEPVPMINWLKDLNNDQN